MTTIVVGSDTASDADSKTSNGRNSCVIDIGYRTREFKASDQLDDDIVCVGAGSKVFG